MANYVFENITDAQAAAFTASDKLIFLNATDLTLDATFEPAGPLTQDAIRITVGGVSRLFSATALSGSSTNNNLTFVSGDVLLLGTVGAQTLNLSTTAVGAVEGKGGEAYGFAGNDTITASVANDTVFGGDGDDRIIGSSTSTETGTSNSVDYYVGGAGADFIIGGDGNDHIYGNVFAGGAGTGDLADTIDGGAGNDFIRGGAGNDSLVGGSGNDRIQGSGDDDSIAGGLGNDDINGNLGNDTVDGGLGDDTVGGGQGNDLVTGFDGNDSVLGGLGDDTVDGGIGNDVVSGGAGNDSLLGGDGNDVVDGGAGNDVILGGLGNDAITGGDGADTITGGTGFDVLTGGAGNDVFSFGANATDASISNVPGAGATAGLTESIADYTDGQDKIDLAFVPTAANLLFDTQGTIFATLQAARTYAQQLMDGPASADIADNATEVVALKLGSDTYLFYYGDPAATAIDSIVKLTGVADPTVLNITGTSDFI